MANDPTQIGEVVSVRGDTVMAAVLPQAAPGLTFSRGHAYFVGQVGAYVRLSIGLVDLYAVVVQVGANASEGEQAEDIVPGRTWMQLELLGESTREGTFTRGISRYPSIGDEVLLVTANDMNRIYAETDQSKSMHIGHVTNAPHLPALLDVTKFVNRHAAVVGSTGSGKSTTVATIVRSLSDPERFPSSRILIIDVHGEYQHAFQARATSFRIDVGESVTARGSSEQLNLPFWALPFDDFLSLAFGSVDENSAAVVQGLVVDSKKAYARKHGELNIDPNTVTPDTPLPFSVRALWMTLHGMHYATHTANGSAQDTTTVAYEVENGDELRGDAELLIAPAYKPATPGGQNRTYLSAAAVNMRRQTNALAEKLRDSRFDFLFRPGPWDVNAEGEVAKDLGSFLETWLGNKRPIVIADLSGVPNQILQRIVSVLLRITYDSLVWSRKLSEGGRQRPMLVVLEEAHRYLNDESAPSGEIVEKIVKEGRKFGVGVLIVSQRPSDIRGAILSQIGSFVVMRLSNNLDRSIVQSTLPDNLSGLFDSVSVLKTGEALVTGESVKLPTRVIIDARRDARPDSADPDLVGRSEPGGWDSPRVPQDYDDVARAWRHLTPHSDRVVKSSKEQN